MFNIVLLTLVMSWQVQGGTRQTLQVTQPVNDLQPARVQIQGNDPDYELQPAMGYNVLDSTGIPIDYITGNGGRPLEF